MNIGQIQREVAKWKKGLHYNVYVSLHVCLKYEKIPSIDTVLILL